MKKMVSPGVDMARLSEVSDGNRQDMQDLSKTYVQTVRLHLKKIAAAIHAEKWTDVEQAAHAALGTSSMVGMIGVLPALKELQSLRKGQTGRAAALLAKAETAFDQISATLQAHRLLGDRPPSQAR